MSKRLCGTALIRYPRFLLCATACILTMNVQTVLADNETANSKSQAILAYSNTNQQCIEASLMGDVLTLKKKNGKAESMSMNAVNRLKEQDFRTMWNLFCFYVVKDIWQSMKRQEKLMGQANFTLEIRADGTYDVKRHALYVPGCAPCLQNAPMPLKAREFWQQIKKSVANIERKEMKIPGEDVESVKLELVAGRDLQVFPRYPFGTYKKLLVRKKDGSINRTLPPN